MIASRCYERRDRRMRGWGMIVDYTRIPLLPPFQPGRSTARMAIPP